MGAARHVPGMLLLLDAAVACDHTLGYTATIMDPRKLETLTQRRSLLRARNKTA